MRRTIKGIICCMLVAAMVLVSVPAEVYASHPDDEAIITVLSDEVENLEITEDIDNIDFSGDDEVTAPLSDNSIREGIVSDDSLSDNTLSADNLMDDTAYEEDDPERDGYIYPKETEYHITFLAMNNGVQKSLEYTNTAGSTCDLTSVLNPTQINNVFMLGYGSNNEIKGWKIEKDGRFSRYITTKDGIATEAFIEPECDYCITAVLDHSVTDTGGLTITAIPTVTYNGKSHVCINQTLNKNQPKTMSNDLEIYVYHLGEQLRYGTDYKISYKNNINASMTMEFEGGEVTYTPKYQEGKDDKKRPCAVITGLGNYKGFSTTAYFDILPYNFGYGNHSTDPLASVSGVKHSYKLVNGRVNGFAPSVSISFPSGKKMKLRSGTDFTPKYYKYEGAKWIEHETIDDTGEWLYAIEGKGSYCGVYFGQESGDTFNDGSQSGSINPAVASYDTASYKACQFKVLGGDEKDIAKARIILKKKKVPYKPGVYYGPEDLGLKVTLGGNVLKIGTDINVIFDGVDYLRVNQASKELGGRIYYMTTDNAEFTNQIWMANKYTIRIEAIDSNPEGYFGTLNTSSSVTLNGVSVNKKWFSLSTPKLKYNGTYSQGGIFSTSYNAKVKPLQDTYYSSDIDSLIPASFRTEFTVGSKTYYSYDYVGAMQAIHNQSYSYDRLRDYYGVHPTSTYAKTPGTYNTVLYPFGPGVNHNSKTLISYNRKAISLKEAWNSGFVKVTCSEDCYYNAGGAIPKVIYIKMYDKEGHEATSSYNMRFSGRICTGSDGDTLDPAKATFTITATNNTAPGTGYLTIKCTGNAFSGVLKKKVPYTIKPRSVTENIQVLKDSDYAVKYGAKTDTLKVSSFDDAGKLYAFMSPVKGTLGGAAPSRPAISLYQSYFRNEEEYKDYRVALKKIDPKKYKLVLTENSSAHGYDVKVTDASSDHYKTGYDFSAAPGLSAVYDVYNEEVTVVSVIGTYGSDSYDLIKDKKVTLPYTGSQIRFDSISVQVRKKDGTLLNMPSASYDVIYGNNIAAGNKTGSVTIVFKKNGYSFDFGSPSKTCKFSIQAVPAGKL